MLHKPLPVAILSPNHKGVQHTRPGNWAAPSWSTLHCNAMFATLRTSTRTCFQTAVDCCLADLAIPTRRQPYRQPRALCAGARHRDSLDRQNAESGLFWARTNRYRREQAKIPRAFVPACGLMMFYRTGKMRRKERSLGE